MIIQIVEMIIISVLLGYIVYLNIQLSRKNIFIESTFKKLSGIEKSRNMNEMMAFLKEIQKLDQYKTYFNEKFLDERTISFILENIKDLNIYIHYTREHDDARSILNNGFKFADSFYKTALPVTKDKLDLTIKHNSRKSFGDYLIIICISRDIFNFYSLELGKAGIKNFSLENILTENPPVRNENSDLVYLLPPQYIKGYINHRTGEVVKNPGYDPEYNSEGFIKNINMLKNK